MLLAPKTHSVHSNVATAPDQLPNHHSSWSHGAESQSQTFTVHTCLPQTVFVKYQCICCPGGFPNSSCTIHTIHSFFLSVFYEFFLDFFVISPSRSKRKLFLVHDFVLLLQQTTFRAPFSKERSRRHWVQVQNGMLWLELTPYTLLWDSSTRNWSGDGVRVSPLNTGWCLPCLDVPLHVKGQMVRPGETSVTVTAFKWLCPSVLPEVSGQLVAPCKTPLTALP